MGLVNAVTISFNQVMTVTSGKRRLFPILDVGAGLGPSDPASTA